VKSVAGLGPGSATASGWIARDESAATNFKPGVIDLCLDNLQDVLLLVGCESNRQQSCLLRRFSRYSIYPLKFDAVQEEEGHRASIGKYYKNLCCAPEDG